MKTDITILCDNYVGRPGFIGEHGFSALIESGDNRYLFDAGSGVGLSFNLKLLEKDLKGVSRIFLSHGHYDHTGGLKWALQEMGSVNVVAHPAVFSRHFVKNPLLFANEPRYIGSPASREELSALGAEFTWVDQTRQVEDGLWFVTGVPCKAGQSFQDPQLLLQDGEGFSPDPISDDASLLIETATDPVLLLGCAHAGVLNILDHLQDSLKIRKLRAILGGTHLMFFSPDRIAAVIRRFEDFGVEQVGVCHCTGMNAAVALGAHFKNRFATAATGSVFSFD
ncbi:MAG: MBL fold metallo-hydrolase [Deltaproteobacteria bacterium]|nr:MBL fold metallo-hydrolase [Deltaproteobacteria bacterium]